MPETTGRGGQPRQPQRRTKKKINIAAFVQNNRSAARIILPLRFDYLAVSFAHQLLSCWKVKPLILDGKVGATLNIDMLNIHVCTLITCLHTLQSLLALELIWYTLTSFHAENFPVSTISENNELQIGMW